MLQKQGYLKVNPFPFYENRRGARTLEKEYLKSTTQKLLTLKEFEPLEIIPVFKDDEVLRIGFDRLVYKIKVSESFRSENPRFQILCVNNTNLEGNLTFNPSKILRGHNVSNATTKEVNLCLGMIKDSIPKNTLFEIIKGKEIEINFNWLTKSNLKYFKFFYIQLVDVLFHEFGFNVADNRINKDNWSIKKNFDSETESIKVFKMKGRHKLISLKVYPKSLREEIEGIPKGMTLMRLELTIYSTSIKSYFKANNIIELNQNILKFFEKLADKLFLRLVDVDTGKVKKTNKYNYILKEFLEPFEKNVQKVQELNKINSF